MSYAHAPGMVRGATQPRQGRSPSGGSLPRAFGRYLLMERLSKGGMGEIYLARHGLSGFEKLVVIKKVLPELVADQGFIRRFIDEAQVAVLLQHANIAQVFEVGRVGEEYFLAMEYVEGRDLRRTLDALHGAGERMPIGTALYIAKEVATGLAYAHRRTNSGGDPLKLVHCDISPPNVMMSFEGETKVIDFGIASSVLRSGYRGDDGGDRGQGFGKYGYMAPEQIIQGRAIDHRTDLYALGVVLFEMLTGRRLYTPDREPDFRELARKVARGEHALPSDVDPELSRYDDLVRRALAPNPSERYQSAAEFRDALQHALVQISPTYSQDDLGSYLRGVFSEEAERQRRVRDELEHEDIRRWAVELSSGSPKTVSFALASLPDWVAAAESGGREDQATQLVTPARGSSPLGGSGKVALLGALVGAALAVMAVLAWGAIAGG